MNTAATYPLLSDWGNDTLQRLTLREKIGQLFCPLMMPVHCGPLDQIELYAERIHHEIETRPPGGYFLNRFYPQSTEMLIALSQRRANIPLLIAADMEAGAGSGLGGIIAEGQTVFPPAMAVGATRFPPYAYEVGYHTAWQARRLGVNYIFAPSLDVNNNPANPIINVRSFGEDPELVAQLGGAMIRGLRDGGVISCAKHFPGHGDTAEDTHLKLARIEGDMARLKQVELLPYAKLMQNPGLDSIMTAHLSVPGLDNGEIPATLSKAILTGLLRETMGFDGLIVTDALLMGGITKVIDPAEAAVRAIEAGADWLLLPPDYNAAHRAVCQAVDNGRLTEERVNQSVARVLTLKEKIAMHDEQDRLFNSPNQSLDEAERISYTISGDAVTLVKNKHNTLPLDPLQPTALVVCQDGDENAIAPDQLFAECEARCEQARFYIVDPNSEEHLPKDEILQDAKTVIFAAIINVLPDKGTVDIPNNFARLIDETLQSGLNPVLVSFGSPYVQARFANFPAFLCAYGYSLSMASAVVEVLYGERKPNGQLPVSLK